MDPIKTQTQQEAKLHFLDYWRIIRIRKTVILAVFLLVVITATLVTFILPETFNSMARIKVERDVPDVPGITETRLMAGTYDPYYIQTEFETIRSEIVLNRVVKDLDLNNEWGRKMNGGQPLKTTETIGYLKARLNLQPVRNTTLIEVEFRWDNPDDAARIANKIAEAYRDYRQELRTRLSKSGITALRAKLEEQVNKVNVAQSNVDYLREKLNIPDMYASVDAPTALISAETVRKLESLRIEGKSEYASLETLYQTKRGLVCLPSPRR